LLCWRYLESAGITGEKALELLAELSLKAMQWISDDLEM